jgi:hypothetical protein
VVVSEFWKEERSPKKKDLSVCPPCLKGGCFLGSPYLGRSKILLSKLVSC